MIDERLREIREFVHEHLNAAMVMVPLARPLPPAMPIRDALGVMDDCEFDLTLVDAREVLVVRRERLREAVVDAPLDDVVTVGESPRSDRLVERSLALGEVARRLQTDSTPLLVVGHDGPEYIVSRADFTRPAGTVAALALFGALDSQLDSLLRGYEDHEWGSSLAPERLRAIDDRYRHARERNEDVSPMSYLTIGERLFLVRELDLSQQLHVNLGDAGEHKLVTDVRNSLAHGRDDASGDEILAALGVAERIIDAVNTVLAGRREPRETAGFARQVTRAFMSGELDLTARPGAPAPGWSGMPEVAAAERVLAAGATERELRLFLTFTAAMDRARESDRLWSAAARLFEIDPALFEPETIVGRELETRELLRSHAVSQRHGADGDAWMRIADTLNEGARVPATRAAIDSGLGDARELLREVGLSDMHGPLLPLLRGPKIAPMWIRMLAYPGRARIANIDVLPVSVDVHPGLRVRVPCW